MSRQREIESELERVRLERVPPTWGTSCHVRDLLHGIHASPFDPALNVRSLKMRCRIRDNNVAYHFKYETGLSIKEYIEGLRIAAAGELLRGGGFNNWEVARAVGYTHLQTFYRAFRRHLGCTPGDFREQPVAEGALAGCEG